MYNLLSLELKFTVIADLSSESIAFFFVSGNREDQKPPEKKEGKKKQSSNDRKSKIFSVSFFIDREIIYVMIKKSELKKDQDISL